MVPLFLTLHHDVTVGSLAPYCRLESQHNLTEVFLGFPQFLLTTLVYTMTMQDIKGHYRNHITNREHNKGILS
jgi:hypothetical protein